MIKRMTNTHAMDHICMKCNECHKYAEDQEEKWHEDVKTVTDFS